MLATLRKTWLTSAALVALTSTTSFGFDVYCPKGPFPYLPIKSSSSDAWEAVANGPWEAKSTWENGSGASGVPGTGDVVCIPMGIEVVIRSEKPAAVVLAPAAGSTEFWPGLRYVRVDGSLRFDIDVDTGLVTDTLYISQTGSLHVGTMSSPVGHNKTCKITILPEVSTGGGANAPHPIDPSWDGAEQSRGVLARGDIFMFGEDRQHVVVVEGDVVPVAGSPTDLLVVDNLWNWESGDDVALAGTSFRRGKTALDPLTDDRFELQINGGTGSAHAGDLTSERLCATHPTTNLPFDLHLVHLERNVVIGSGWETYFPGDEFVIAARGHFMFADGENTNGSRTVELNHVRFDEFGRTNKQLPLDDVEINFNSLAADCATSSSSYQVTAAPGFIGSSYSGSVDNRRGRYAVHFHKNGHDLPGAVKKVVRGCVVTGTPGWGFVNHSSHVDFIDCVCHDFAGSAFVTESGDEVGSFRGCVAMHGTGMIHTQSADHYIFHRGVFGEWKLNGNQERDADDPRFRPQPLSDFAFGGEGFWFQGPLISATDNIANSCSGAGMFWFPTGAINDYSPRDAFPQEKERYAGFPLSELVHVYPAATHAMLTGMSGTNPLVTGPRIWAWPGGNPEEHVVLSDLPILECDGFQCYASLVGIHLRFSNENAESFFNEDPFHYDCEIPEELVSYAPENRPVQKIKNADLWNNEQGFRARYCESTDWVNINVVNEIGSYSTRLARIGAELNHQVRKHVVHDVTIEGYGVALLVQDRTVTFPNGNDNSGQLDFGSGTFAVDNYAIRSHIAGRVSTAAGQTGLWPRTPGVPCRQQTWIDSSTVHVTGSGPYFVTWNAMVTPHVAAVAPVCTLAFPQTYPQRFMIRYREIYPGNVKSERYRYVVHTTPVGVFQNSVEVPGLQALKEYEIQILSDHAGAQHPAVPPGIGGPLSLWSDGHRFQL